MGGLLQAQPCYDLSGQPETSLSLAAIRALTDESQSHDKWSVCTPERLANSSDPTTVMLRACPPATDSFWRKSLASSGANGSNSQEGTP